MKYQCKPTVTSRTKLLPSLCVALVFGMVCLEMPVFAQNATNAEQKQRFELNIPAQDLSSALNTLSVASRTQIAGGSTVLNGKTSQAVTGSYTVSAALTSLLEGTGLVMSQTGDNSYAVTVSENSVQPQQPMEEVTVTGSYTTRSMNGATGLDMTLRETPQSVSIITAQMIEDLNLVDMADLLQNTPGISMVGDASEDHIIYVRGFELDSSIQVDGLITTTANVAYSGSLAQGLDPIIAERVEVLKGAAGILSGLGEPSATVNMIRKRPTKSFQGNVALNSGRWGNFGGDADLSGALNDSGTVRGRVVGSFSSGEYFLDRYETNKHVLYGVVEADITESTKISLAVDTLNSESDGVYNWNSNPAFYTDGTLLNVDRTFTTGQGWAFRNVEEVSVTPEIEHQFESGWFVKASYRYSDAAIDVLNASLGDYVDSNTNELVGAYWSDGPEALHSDRESETESFNLYTTGQFLLFGKEHEVVFGYSQAQNEFKRISTYEFVDSAFVNDVAVPAPVFDANSEQYGDLEHLEQDGFYGTVRFHLAEPLTLMMGGRVSSWEFTNDDAITGENYTDVSDSNIFTPYAGIVYDLNDFASLYASYTGIFRPQVYYDADNNILDPTEGTNTELGVKFAFFNNRLNASAAIYESNKDNVAEYAGIGQNSQGNWIYGSIDGVHTDGYEFEIAGSLTPEWNISAGYTHNEAEDEEGNVRETYVPEDVFKFTTSYDFDEYIEGLTLGTTITWQSDSYYEDGIYFDPNDFIPFRQEQPSYTIVDVMGRYELGQRASLRINVSNLLDEVYSRSLWGYGDFGEPRNFTATVAWSF